MIMVSNLVKKISTNTKEILNTNIMCNKLKKHWRGRLVNLPRIEGSQQSLYLLKARV